MTAKNLIAGISTGLQGVDWPDLLALWREAERLGYDSGWLPDHFLPVGPNPDNKPWLGGPCPECWTTLTALGMNTKKIRLGTLVIGNSYRHPAVLAKMGATLDVLSGGRVELGLGAGWYHPEYFAYGIPMSKPAVRIRQLAEAVQVVKLLWSERAPTFAGKYYQLKEAFCEPKPLQENPTIWVGGGGEQLTLRVVAEHADGWNIWLGGIEEYRHKLEVLDGHCQAVGRDPSTVRKSLALIPAVSYDKGRVEAMMELAAAQRLGSLKYLRIQMVAGTPEECAEQLLPFVRIGVELFVLSMRPPYDYESLQLFAERVMPILREGYSR